MVAAAKRLEVILYYINLHQTASWCMLVEIPVHFLRIIFSVLTKLPSWPSQSSGNASLQSMLYFNIVFLFLQHGWVVSAVIQLTVEI